MKQKIKPILLFSQIVALVNIILQTITKEKKYKIVTFVA